MTAVSIVARLSDFAEGQWGQVTLDQAAGASITVEDIGELVHARVLEPVVDRVVRIRGGARHPFPRLLAAWLLLDPAQPAWERTPPASGVVSHTSAVRLYRTGDLPGPEPEFTFPSPPPRHMAGPTIHVAPLEQGDWRELHGLPVTRPARTLVDLAGGGTLDVAEIGRLAGSLLRNGWATQEELAAALDRHLLQARRPGTGHDWLMSLLASADSEPGHPEFRLAGDEA